MSDDTKLETCSTCATWNTEFRLAGKIASCAALGFSSGDSCKNWTNNGSSRIVAFIRVREPSLTEIMAQKDLREPWKEIKEAFSQTTTVYDSGYYYYFFDNESVRNAEKFARTLSQDTYIKKSQGAVLPIRLANLEDEDRHSFLKIAEISSRK